ncbi:hypothetical protein CPC08DRAFT_476235 [Agrocybe pediades]|nr:hypothetical protein CPC08DRAFT_476235 [Agrocybe pediades]
MEDKDPTDVDWVPPLEDTPRPFDIINRELAALGALSVNDYLNDTYSFSASFDGNSYVQASDVLSVPTVDVNKEAKAASEDNSNAVTARTAISILRQTCQSTFGSSDALKYEFLEDSRQGKQCILTIARPGGASRSYTSGVASLSRADLKGLAAQAAIDLGAIEFITVGDKDALKAKKGLLQNPLDVIDLDGPDATPGPDEDPQNKASTSKLDPIEEPLKNIENCCYEWRAGKIKPHWFSFSPGKKKTYGAAMRISLNSHAFRAYSVDAVYETPKEAKLECAKAALKEGVLDFIKYGNGQTEPTAFNDDDVVESMSDTGTPPPSKAMDLQEFFASLPKPFPEDLGNGAAVDVNVISYLNQLMQSARGGKLSSSFQPISDTGRMLHGCILRIERPGETRTYIVDPVFTKRADARPGVALLAMSQGLGDYLRSIKHGIDDKLPPDMRTMANVKFMQMLSMECCRVRAGNRPVFLFSSDHDAFGCTMKVDISSKENHPDVRQYTVGADYRSKADARIAVVAHAVERGLIDILRFRGLPPPPDYIPYWDAMVHGKGDTYVPKKKEKEQPLPAQVEIGARDTRKRRKDDDGSQDSGDVALPPKKRFSEALPPTGPRNQLPPTGPRSQLPPTGPRNQYSRSWKKPQANVSRGLGPANGHDYASSQRSAGQDPSGNRSGGPSSPVRYNNNHRGRDRDRNWGRGHDERGHSEMQTVANHYFPSDDRTINAQGQSSYYPTQASPSDPAAGYHTSAYGTGYSHAPYMATHAPPSSIYPASAYPPPQYPSMPQAYAQYNYVAYYPGGPQAPPSTDPYAQYPGSYHYYPTQGYPATYYAYPHDPNSRPHPTPMTASPSVKPVSPAGGRANGSYVHGNKSPLPPTSPSRRTPRSPHSQPPPPTEPPPPPSASSSFFSTSLFTSTTIRFVSSIKQSW